MGTLKEQLEKAGFKQSAASKKKKFRKFKRKNNRPPGNSQSVSQQKSK